MKKKFLQSGFTLLEVMVAFTLLSIAFGAILSFLVTSLRATQFTEQEFIAHGLSQEGLEMVRALRDKRFLECENISEPCSWKAFAKNSDADENEEINSTDSYQVFKNFFAEEIFFLESIQNETSEKILLCENEENRKLYMPGNFSDPQISCKDSGFKRIITFPNETVSSLSGNNVQNDSIIVRAKVFWFDGAETKEFVLEEVLYNWKP